MSKIRNRTISYPQSITAFVNSCLSEIAKERYGKHRKVSRLYLDLVLNFLQSEGFMNERHEPNFRALDALKRKNKSIKIK